jgi:3-oxoacyl-[acyl-carrier-protein] synthase II
MQVAGEATSFTGSIGDYGELESGVKKSIRKALKLMCRETQMAVAAAQLALADAGLNDASPDPEGSGVVLGSDYMLTMPADYVRAVTKCATGAKFDFSRWGDEGLAEVEPLWMLRYLPNMPASHVAIFNDFRGPNNSLTMREASGLMAIGEAFRIIARGHANRMIAGATGTRLMPMQAIHVMQTEQLAPAGDDPSTASRPFDKSRQGMVAGEGAATVILESLESAEARGATILGEVLGFGTSLVTSPNLKGNNVTALANSMRTSLADARVAPQDLGHINSHGLATIESDIAEARAIGQVFGDRPVPVAALKSYFGNLGAGGGVVEIIGSLLALKHDALPRVLNYQTSDPDCPVAAVADDSTPPGESFVSTNVTPQGQAAAVVVGRAG